MASVHALEFGSAPHEHNGYACVALSTDDHAGVAAQGSALETKAIHSLATASVSNTPVVGSCAALPPATGPPLSI